MKNLAFGKVGSCFILVVAKTSPSDVEWDEYLQYLRANLDPDVHPQTLVVSAGGAPTAAQRQLLNELTAPYATTAPIAVLTSAPVVRGVVTALSWQNPHYRDFPLSHLDDALSHLGVSGREAAEVKDVIAALREQIEQMSGR